MIWKLFLGSMLFLIDSVQAKTINVCSQDPDFITGKILPEINSGIAKRIATVIRCGDETKTILNAQMKKNLWKNVFELSLDHGVITILQGSDEFSRALCLALEFSEKPICGLESQYSEIIILLNPNNEAISSLMKGWSKRNAGVYRNLGMRLRWESLSEVEKSEKIIFKARLGAQ